MTKRIILPRKIGVLLSIAAYFLIGPLDVSAQQDLRISGGIGMAAFTKAPGTNSRFPDFFADNGGDYRVHLDKASDDDWNCGISPQLFTAVQWKYLYSELSLNYLSGSKKSRFDNYNLQYSLAQYSGVVSAGPVFPIKGRLSIALLGGVGYSEDRLGIHEENAILSGGGGQAPPEDQQFYTSHLGWQAGARFILNWTAMQGMLSVDYIQAPDPSKAHEFVNKNDGSYMKYLMSAVGPVGPGVTRFRITASMGFILNKNKGKESSEVKKSPVK